MSYIGCQFLQINHHLHYSPFHAKGLTIIRCNGQQKKLIKKLINELQKFHEKTNFQGDWISMSFQDGSYCLKSDKIRTGRQQLSSIEYYSI